MYKVALFARLEAKPGKENEVAKLWRQGWPWQSKSQRRLCGSLCGWARQRSAYSTRLPTKTDVKRI